MRYKVPITITYAPRTIIFEVNADDMQDAEDQANDKASELEDLENVDYAEVGDIEEL